MIFHDRPADRTAGLAVVVLLLVVLRVQHGCVVERAQYEPRYRPGAHAVAEVVVVTLAVEGVAARLGHGADDTAQRAAVLGVDAAGLDLHFLQVLEYGVFPGPAVDQAVGRDAVDQKRVLGSAGAVNGEARLDLTGIHARRNQRDALKAPRLRDAIELLSGHIVRQRDALEVDLLFFFGCDVHRLGDRARLQLGVDVEGFP